MKPEGKSGDQSRSAWSTSRGAKARNKSERSLASTTGSLMRIEVRNQNHSAVSIKAYGPVRIDLKHVLNGH